MALALVCGDCRVGLEAFGATVDTSPRSIGPGTACEAHPTPRRAQAMHAVVASPEVLRRFQVANRETQPSIEPRFRGEAPDWALVASLAATIAVGTDEPMSDDLIRQSVDFARRVVEVSKGG